MSRCFLSKYMQICRGMESFRARLSDFRSVVRTLNCIFFFNDTATTDIYTLSLHDARRSRPASGSAPHPPPESGLVHIASLTVAPPRKVASGVELVGGGLRR